MSRRAQMIGLAGAAALVTGLALATPASAATTPPATLTMSNLGGAQICNGAGQHQFVFQITLNRGTGDDVNDALVDITSFEVTLTEGGDPQNALSSFQAGDDPIQPGDSFALASVIGPGTGGQLSATATIIAVDEEGDEEEATPVELEFGPVAYAACGQPGQTTTTSSTSTSSTSTSSTSSTTSTTTGDTTTSTTGGTTTSTSTTLGPNDTTGALTVSPSTVAQGSSVAVSGSGFAANATVTLTLFSDPITLGTLTANANGAISGSVTIPASAPTGAHRIEAKGANANNGNNILSANVQVTSRGSTIARTGGPNDFLLPVGIAVVSFGILAFAWRERRLTQG